MSSDDELQPLFLLSDEPIGSNNKNGFENDPFARTIASAALGTTGPFTIGVYGGWGSGKTSALRAAKSMIDSSPSWVHVVTVEFNAWRFEREEHPIVPMVATIERAIAEKAASLAKDNQDEHSTKISWYKNAGMQCRAFLTGWQFKVKPEVGIPLIGKLAFEAEWSAQKTIQRLADLQKEFKSIDGEHWSALRESCLSLSAFDALDRVGDAVGNAAGDAKANWPLVVVFIDDLDRCQADKAFELLESVKLVLCQPGFVFVLALNHAVVDGYLTYRAEKLYGKDNLKLHRSYLEKIVQLPLAMPSRSERLTEFAGHLVATRLSKAADAAMRDGLVKLAPLLALAADATPRTLVRAINGVLLDISMRDASDLHGVLKNEAPPYPLYSGLCVVQRALERSIGPELTRDLARHDVLCTAILNDPVWGAYDALQEIASHSEEVPAGRPALIVTMRSVSGENSGSRYRAEDMARWREVVNAIRERSFLWEERQDYAGMPISGSALFTSEAGKHWLKNREQRLMVMKAAVAASIPPPRGDAETPIAGEAAQHVGRASSTAGHGAGDLDDWVAAITTLAKEERAAIETAARRSLGLSPNAVLDTHAWSRVEVLNLGFEPITDAGVAWLARADCKLVSLVELDLGRAGLTIRGVKALAGQDSGLKRLRSLSLANAFVGDHDIAELCNPCTAMNGLTLLDLTGTQVTDVGLSVLVGKTSGVKKLVSLYLTNTHISDIGLRAISDAHDTLRSLRRIYLGGTAISDRGVAEAAGADSALKSIEVLSIAATQTSDLVAHILASESSGLNKLTELSIGNEESTDKRLAGWHYKRMITDAAMGHLARPGGKLGSLRVLDVSSSSVSDAGLVELVRSDTTLQRLRSLRLNNTEVTDEGMKSLAKAAAGLASLSSLYLGGTRVTDDGLNAVKSRFPEIELHHSKSPVDAAIATVTSSLLK